MDFGSLHAAVLSVPDLAQIVSLNVDVLETPQVPHLRTCENLTASTDLCNYIADGANLCAQAHSAAWQDFMFCMYSVAQPGPCSNISCVVRVDDASPLGHAETFDKQLTHCGRILPDYTVADLQECTYGAEGTALRTASAAKTPQSAFRGPVWVQVDGKDVLASNNEEDSRKDWQKTIVAAVCAAYTGEKPMSCAA